MKPCKPTSTEPVPPITAEDIIAVLEEQRDEMQRHNLMRFFKTGKGDYGEGDEFIGLKVPQTREVVKVSKGLVPFDEIEKLLESRWHEARLCGFLLLVEEMKRALPKRTGDPAGRREEIAEFYLRHARRANNWDLVDMSCPKIIGWWLLYSDTDRSILDTLAGSDNLWEQRISIVSTWMLIRHHQFDDALRVSERLLGHSHDLIHKAVGWMLREVGKHDMNLLRDFLATHYPRLHRTTLRYAIEKMDEYERQQWLTGDISAAD